ncbi:hypothetical protein ACVW0Y_003462 [Pseudomonas sp. TE3786]
MPDISSYLSAPLPPPLAGIDTIMLVGASIENGMANGFLAAALDYVQVGHGLTDVVAVQYYGFSGMDPDGIYAKWTTIVRPALAARSDGGAGVLILSMPTGNAVTALVPYASANPTTLAQKKATLDLLNAEMKAQCGDTHVLIFNNTFRLYGAPSTTCLVNQDMGAKPFNEEWIDPLSYQVPWNFYCRSYGYPYPIAYNWYTKVLIDSTHYNPLGYQLLLKYWMDVAAAMIKGTPPPYIPLKEDPINDQVPKAGRALVVYRPTATVTRSSTHLIANARGSTAPGTDLPEAPYLCPWEGHDPVLGLGARPALSGTTTQTGMGTGNNTHSLLNDTFRGAYTFTTSPTFVVLEEIINLQPLQQFRYRVLCCRKVTAGQTRLQEFSNDGVNVSGSIDCAYVTGSTPKIYVGFGTADEQGKARIWLRCAAGNTAGAFANAIEINPLPL